MPVNNPARINDYILIIEEQTSGTSGGTFTSGSWVTRTLNAEKQDTGNYATLSSNQITLLPGTYRFHISCLAIAVEGHQARLWNVTDSISYPGSSKYAAASSGGCSDSEVMGRFTIASSKVFEVQHQCSSTYSGTGFGGACNFGESEVFTIAEFWRE